MANAAAATVAASVTASIASSAMASAASSAGAAGAAGGGGGGGGSALLSLIFGVQRLAMRDGPFNGALTSAVAASCSWSLGQFGLWEWVRGRFTGAVERLSGVEQDVSAEQARFTLYFILYTLHVSAEQACAVAYRYLV